MHNYHAQHDCFPPAYIADEDGEPMHSWRVLLLPYLEEVALYDAYDFDEPWDGPNNLALAAMIPDVYRCGDEVAGDPAETSYLMIVGEGTISDGPTPSKMRDITDGTSMTIMVVESTRTGICWTEPRDLDAANITYLVNDGSEQGIRSDHGVSAHALYCDGSVRTLEAWHTAGQIRALSTIAGGEAVDPDVPQPY
jgi:prepilin-type processing-associated H-X9-DG protein